MQHQTVSEAALAADSHFVDSVGGVTVGHVRDALTQAFVLSDWRAIIKLLRNHGWHATVAACACNLLNELSAPGAAQAAASHGMLPAVVTVLKTHQYDAGVLLCATAALTRLVAHNPAYAGLACCAGGVKAVVKAMSRFPRDGAVQAQACAALVALAAAPDNISLAYWVGAVEHVLLALRSHQSAQFEGAASVSSCTM